MFVYLLFKKMNQHYVNNNILTCDICFDVTTMSIHCKYCKKCYCELCNDWTNIDCNICKKTIDENKICGLCMPNVSAMYECDICVQKTCKSCISWQHIKYESYNVAQWLKICNHCTNSPQIFIKGSLLLATNYQNRCTIKNNYVIDHKINDILRTLLLISNIKNKNINKQCFIQIIIPYFISIIINNKKPNVGEMLTKCMGCLEFCRYVINSCSLCKEFPTNNYMLCESCAPMLVPRINPSGSLRFNILHCKLHNT